MLLLLCWRPFPALALTVLLAPALLSMARKDKLFLWMWILLLLLVAAAWLMPVWNRYFGMGAMIPASLARARLLGLWAVSFKKASRKKQSLSLVLYGFNCFALAAMVLLHAGVACFRYVPMGAIPMLSGMIIAAVAVAVVLLCVSAFTRRLPWDLVIGAVLFGAIWMLLGVPGFDYFL